MTAWLGNGKLLCAAGFVAWWLLAAGGCGGGGGDGPPRFDVSGSVTFNSQPVPFGRIVFDPDTAAGNKGPQGFAEIRDGRYDTRTGRGIVGGAHVVRISGFGKDPKTGNEDNPVPALFPDYQTKVELPKQESTQDFEVPAK